MRSVIASLLAVALLAGSLHAQIGNSAETKYILSGIDGYTTAGDLVLVPDGSKPKLEAVGLVTIDCEASTVAVRASDAKRQPVNIVKLPGSDDAAAKQFIVLGSGQVWIDVTCIDFATQFFDQTQFSITIGDSPEPEPVDPVDPVDPDVPDVPDSPSPFAGDGLRAMIVYELDDMPNYAPSVTQQLFSQKLRAWARENCAKSASGSTDFRVLDKDAEGDSSIWTEALKRPRKSTPWIVVGNGESGYEGPLPATESETMELLKRFVK